MNRDLCILVAALLAAVGAARADEETGTLPTRLDAAVQAATGAELATPADEAALLRRLWLDLAGHVPPAHEARAYLEDPRPEKRAELVERLLRSDDFTEHWGGILTTWVTGERPIAREVYDGRVLREYWADGLRRGESYARMARELIAGTGSSDRSGPANFLLRYEADPARLAGAVGKELLGVSIQCAQCHDHPFARWNQDDFWGLAASFARVRRMGATTGENLYAIVEVRQGELRRPEPAATPAEGQEAIPPVEKVVRPRPLDGSPLPPAGRREALADWIVVETNPFFARNVVNRVWGHLFGQPLVRGLDADITGTPSGAVLGLLADDFVSSKHDLRHLIRVIVTSRAYSQVTGTGTPGWGRPTPRPLDVEQLFASITQATGYDGPFPGPTPEEAADEEDAERDAEAAIEAEAPALLDDRTDHPVDALTERPLTLQRSLVLLNGPHAQEAARAAVAAARAACGPKLGDAHIEWAFLATLSRIPTDDERTLARSLARPAGSAQGLEDLVWALINSAEFQTNH
jgi:hypothetical protein